MRVPVTREYARQFEWRARRSHYRGLGSNSSEGEETKVSAPRARAKRCFNPASRGARLGRRFASKRDAVAYRGRCATARPLYLRRRDEGVTRKHHSEFHAD